MSDSTVFYASADFDEVGCCKKEAFRFLGCERAEKDNELECLYDDCVGKISTEVFFRAVWRKSSLSFVGENTVRLDFGEITSASLCKNLEKCKYVYVFAATAGMGVDRLLTRYRQLDVPAAMMLSAIGSSAIECWCDRINEEISKGKKTRPRFSPGYGGVDLRHQREIIDFLDGEKRLGITLTDSFFMTPVKSVTAFIGVEEE